MVGDLVGTLMTNLGLEVALREQGIGLARANVGDRYILERLQAEGWVLGGEPSGHIICRDRTTTGDGIIAALQVLAEMRMRDQDLDQLIVDLEPYPQVLVNVRLPRKVDVLAVPAVSEAIREVEAELDEQGRVLLRPSGTEPLIRVMVEGREQDQVERLAGHLADAVRVSLESE
jgi:phosphoglucosamine mutase